MQGIHHERPAISTSQKDSPCGVKTDTPASSDNPSSSRSACGASSVPKENSQPANLVAQTLRVSRDSSNPSSAVETDITEQVADIVRLLRAATNLSRAFSSCHLRKSDNASSGEVSITDISLLFDCSEKRASKLRPWIMSTLERARRKAIPATPTRDPRSPLPSRG